MKRYCITISTPYGTLTIDDVQADSEDQAFELACEMAASEVENFAKLEEAHEYADKPDPRYYIDERVGIIAVRDRLHPDYDPDEQGLHPDTPDVVWFTFGHRVEGVAGLFTEWRIDDKDKQEAQEALAAFQNGKFEKANGCQCGKPVNPAFDPCCSLECWTKQFENIEE